jgi:hypothetical protein
MDRPGHAKPDPQHLVGRHLRVFEHLARELLRLVQATARVVVVRHLPTRLREDRVREIPDRHGQMALAEVDPDRDARLPSERDQHRRAAAAWHGVCRAFTVDDEAVALKV